MKIISKVLLVNRKHEVLLVRRGETAPRRPLQWDFPGGFVDRGEHLATAAIRELKEETGIVVDEAEMVYAASYGVGEASDKEPAIITYWLSETQNSDVILSYEHDKFEWVSIERALEKITYDKQKHALHFLIHENII